MVSFQVWICFAVLVSSGTGAPHQNVHREPHSVPEKFHKTASLEEELAGKSGLHLVAPETQKPVPIHDGSHIDDNGIDVKDILLRFFKKLKNHPEILQQLIESEEKRLLEGYENMLELEQMKSNPDSSPHQGPAIENSIPVPYQNEKMVVKKGGSSQMNFDPEYDPRSAPGFSGPSSDSDMNNNIPPVPENQQQNSQPSANDIANLEKQQSPFINSLPLFDKLPNPSSADKLNAENIKADSPPTVKSHKQISEASFDSNIEEIKHVPIREELASEVPPSLLADKKELREEAHQALKKAEAEALKTKKFQATLQKEQLEQMAKAQKAKQAQEVEDQEHQYEKQAQKQEEQQRPEASDVNEVVEQNDVDPYGYYYYYYNYPELSQQVFNDDAEESKESYQPEADNNVSDSVGSDKPQNSNESIESHDNSIEQKDSNASDQSQERSYSSESNSNDSDGGYISSEEVTVNDDNEQSSEKENELKALTKPQSVQMEKGMKNNM